MTGVLHAVIAGGAVPIALAAPTVVAIGTIQGSAAALNYDLATGTPTIAATLLDNDILFGLLETANEPVASTPSGFTMMTTYGVGTAADAAATCLTPCWKRINGAQGNPGFGDAGDHTIGRLFLIRGCRTSGDPVVALSGSAASHSESDAFDAASTTIDQCLVMHAIAHPEDTGADFVVSWTSPNLTGGTSLAETGSTLGNGGGIGAYAGVKASAGSLGTVTADLQNLTQPLNLARATFAFIPVGA